MQPTPQSAARVSTLSIWAMILKEEVAADPGLTATLPEANVP